jgi:hypothetical protein
VEALQADPEGLWAGFGFGAIDVAAECGDLRWYRFQGQVILLF